MKTIAVSAGHNPQAQGAEWKGVTEYMLAQQWASELTGALVARGARVVPVPTGGLTSKIASVNASTASVAVEIHFNSDPKHAGTGSETLYCPGSEKGRRLAEKIQAAISSFCGPNRGAKEGWYRMDPAAGVKDAFLDKTRCVAVIIEPYFIHELQRITANQAIVCDIVAQELTEFE